MPLTRHGFCALHRIAYDRDLDATCPQCMLAGILPPRQYDFDEIQQMPVDGSGKLLDPRGEIPLK